jgi:ClpP class serine protease
MTSKLLRAIQSQPLAISDRGHRELAAWAAADGKALAILELQDERPEPSIDDEGIAHVHISGILGANLDMLDRLFGATDYEDIEGELDEIAGEARGLMLHIDSPGGMVEGMVEVAQAIEALPIPKMAWVSSQATSAAYYLAAATDIIAGRVSASYGSIGVIVPWTDASARWEQEGLIWAPITGAGNDLKGAFYGPSLTDDQRQHVQDEVDDIMDGFKAHVQSSRPDIDAAVWRSGVYRGERAMAMGLVDAVTGYAQAYELLLDEVEFGD